MKNDYISISEFAAAAGVSQQSVYKRLRNKDDAIQPFCKKIDGKKYISKYAIDIIYRDEEPQETTQEEQTEEPQEEPTEKANENVLMTILQQQLETLRNELEVKNKQIENLNNRLAEANNLISQQQQLQLLDTQRIAALEAAAADTEETENEEIKQEEEPKKRGFLGLFKKKK